MGLVRFWCVGGEQGEEGRGTSVTFINGSFKQCGSSFSSVTALSTVLASGRVLLLWWPGAALTNEDLKQNLSLC